MSEFELTQNISNNNQVKVIKFKRLSEDDFCKQEQKPAGIVNKEKNVKNKRNSKKMISSEIFDNQSIAESIKNDNNETNNNNYDKNSKRRKIISNNFSLQYTYPAVIFDKICFSIDKSQQQSSFLNEILYKISNCFQINSTKNSNEATKSNQVEILKSINLNVPYGSIFGLLGPSSCGKTTLLRCLVGLLKPTSGSVRLFGHNSPIYENKTNNKTCCFCGGLSKCFTSCCCCCCDSLQQENNNNNNNDNENFRSRCKVPGSNVGYMPQDLGLYEDFSITQLLRMFGRYMGMNNELIEKRIEFMAKFLDLPDVDREISSLSGGQKRRVSFAVACLHMPPLIILDEPTVGVDPLLRKSIWKYLRRLADEENKTIIITTHYIEEAAQADQVAFMRAGEILVQDSPEKIMQSNGSRTLEEAFLKICNNVKFDKKIKQEREQKSQHLKLYPQPTFKWHDKFEPNELEEVKSKEIKNFDGCKPKQEAQDRLALFDLLYSEKEKEINEKLQHKHNGIGDHTSKNEDLQSKVIEQLKQTFKSNNNTNTILTSENRLNETSNQSDEKIENFLGNKLTRINRSKNNTNNLNMIFRPRLDTNEFISKKDKYFLENNNIYSKSWTDTRRRVEKFSRLLSALIYKNYKRNLNSIPLLVFQFLLPVIQMISFSLCVGGRPTNIGLGLVNNDQLPSLEKFSSIINTNQLLNSTTLLNTTQPITNLTFDSGGLTSLSSSLLANNSNDYEGYPEELLSDVYLSFIDSSMISIKYYKNLNEALTDVRHSKLWAAMEIGENFTETILKRFDFENFYQLEASTIQQSVIKLYPDRSNKVLDMICQRSLMNSYRQFLLSQFSQLRQLPIEVKEPIFYIKPNLISNSIDGYTESIAAGLLASLTYIMAAGLTTFIMVVERSEGILERTYTSGINPVTYLLAHALFRSIVMMFQIALVMILTFYVLKQPLVGSIWLAYIILMTLNLTGISYGLLISSIVTDQNGAALTIVSSLVVKITMSGILWPFEAIPRWLRAFCYIQPLTMPIQALKGITLKGNTINDRAVYLGFLVSIVWLLLFLTIAAKRFKFYQH